MNVLYEDNHLLVVEKPVNIPVQADASGDVDLLTLAKEYIKEKYAKPGEVYLQTFSPEAPAIAAAASDGGFVAFATQELRARKESYFPPYCRMAVLLFRAKDEVLAQSWADLYAKSLASWAKRFNTANQGDFFRVSEAEEAPLLKAEGWFRYQVVVRAPSAKDIVAAVMWMESARPAPKELRVSFDVDAQNFC